MGVQQLGTAIPTANFRSLFSYTQGPQKPQWASFLSLLVFLALVEALVEPLHSRS